VADKRRSRRSSALTRSYFAFLNYASALLFALATIATGFFATPLLIHWLGQEQFGASRMLLGIFGYLSLLEFGLGGAIAPMLAKAVGERNSELASKTLAVAVNAYLRVSFLSVLVGVSASFLIWKLGLIQVSPRLRVDLLTACLLSIPGFLLLPCVPFRILLDVRQAGYVVNMALAVHAVLVGALAVWFAMHGAGISGQAAAISIGTITFYAAIAVYAARYASGFAKAAFEPLDRHLKSGLERLAAPSMVMSASNRLSVLSDDLIVGLMLEPTAVAGFFVLGRLAGLVRQQLESIVGAVWAGLTNLHVKEDREGFRRGIVEATKAICVLGSSVLAPVIAFNDAFVNLWVGRLAALEGAQLVCPAASACAILVALNALWCWTFTGAGKVRLISAHAAVGASVNVLCSVLLTYRYGIGGPLLGTIVAYLALPMWYLPWKMKREFGVEPRRLAFAALGPTSIGIVEALTLLKTASFGPADDWWMLGVKAGLALVVCLAINFWICHSAAEREIWRRRALSIAALLGGRIAPGPLPSSANQTLQEPLNAGPAPSAWLFRAPGRPRVRR
jgi:O-antigen/teichoic acid export membrane protein